MISESEFLGILKNDLLSLAQSTRNELRFQRLVGKTRTTRGGELKGQRSHDTTRFHAVLSLEQQMLEAIDHRLTLLKKQLSYTFALPGGPGGGAPGASGSGGQGGSGWAPGSNYQGGGGAPGSGGDLS